ncbi:MAG: hypothetical protein PSU94_06780 [Lacunisphaera sp.]|nr:hypothetical protein [Lacunisphaera sp.]
MAAVCAALVWLLGLLAVSPPLHASLHSETNHQDHTCAVTLFGHGVDHSNGLTELASAPVLFPAGECICPEAVPAGESCFLQPPTCGPPLG